MLVLPNADKIFFVNFILWSEEKLVFKIKTTKINMSVFKAKLRSEKQNAVIL